MVALTAALLAGCGIGGFVPPRPDERPDMDFPLDGVTSVCDRFGHRVYRYYTGNSGQGSITVVPNDATCIKATIR